MSLLVHLQVYQLSDMEKQTNKANLYAALFLVIGVVAAIAMFVQVMVEKILNANSKILEIFKKSS